MRREDHVLKARTLAEESLVLLKNSDNILPLPKDNLTVAVIGPHAHSKRAHLGSWCLDGKIKDITSIHEGILANVPGINVITEDAAFSDEMVECAHRADAVILCVGESHRRTGEARNLAELALPAGQEELIKAIGETGKPLVVVQCTGRPLPSPATEQFADALLYAWQCGTEAGHAVARVLFGEVSPSGRLPITVPRSTGQVPIYYARKPMGKMRDFQDYMPYKDMSVEPLYPFGFGLSYSPISYSNLSVKNDTVSFGDSQQVTVVVKNEGKVEASEVVQCYIRQVVADTTRPERELKDFCKVTLKPGESREVTLTLTAEKLSFYGSKQCFHQHASQINVFVGSDSRAENTISFDLIEG